MTPQGAPHEMWKRQAEAFGEYLRVQRRLADLSLRDLASMTSVSNAYLSQLERGLHQPSARVLTSLADALGVSASQLLGHFGLSDPSAGPEEGDPGDEEPVAGVTVAAIQADPKLSEAQKQALLDVYRAFVSAAG